MDIHSFASRGDATGVSKELAKGVPVDIRDERNYTPLAYAAKSPSADESMLRLLVEEGANVSALVAESESFPLGIAAGSGSVEKVQVLLDAGADTKFESPKGYTVLIHIMHTLHDDERLVPMAEFLLQNGAETDCETEYGESPLSVASLMGRFDAVKSLLDAGADPTPLRWTELMKAVAFGSSSEVQRLLEGGSKIDDRDRWDRTPWLLTAFVKDIAKAKMLHSVGANINDRDRGGDTVLMHCSARGNAERLPWLIEIGAEIDAINGFGKTALMSAAEAGNEDSVRLLLKAGANPSQKNEYNDNVIRNQRGASVALACHSQNSPMVGSCRSAVNTKTSMIPTSAFTTMSSFTSVLDSSRSWGIRRKYFTRPTSIPLRTLTASSTSLAAWAITDQGGLGRRRSTD
jgi:ankyrin repeat protein